MKFGILKSNTNVFTGLIIICVVVVCVCYYSLESYISGRYYERVESGIVVHTFWEHWTLDILLTLACKRKREGRGSFLSKCPNKTFFSQLCITWQNETEIIRMKNGCIRKFCFSNVKRDIVSSLRNVWEATIEPKHRVFYRFFDVGIQQERLAVIGFGLVMERFCNADWFWSNCFRFDDHQGS